jgi:hypothetical protein
MARPLSTLRRLTAGSPSSISSSPWVQTSMPKTTRCLHRHYPHPSWHFTRRAVPPTASLAPPAHRPSPRTHPHPHTGAPSPPTSLPPRPRRNPTVACHRRAGVDCIARGNEPQTSGCGGAPPGERCGSPGHGYGARPTITPWPALRVGLAPELPQLRARLQWLPAPPPTAAA